MNDRPASENVTASSNENLKEIKESLESIERQLRNENWRTALIVGAIVTVLQIGGAAFTSCRQESLKTDLASKLEANSVLGREITLKKLDFYKSAVDLLHKIDSHFQQACYFETYRDAEKQLPELLDSYRALLAQPTVELDTNEISGKEIIGKLRAYSDYVTQKWVAICSPKLKVSDDEKNKSYMESRKLLEQARQYLSKLIKVN